MISEPLNPRRGLLELDDEVDEVGGDLAAAFVVQDQRQRPDKRGFEPEGQPPLLFGTVPDPLSTALSQGSISTVSPLWSVPLIHHFRVGAFLRSEQLLTNREAAINSPGSACR